MEKTKTKKEQFELEFSEIVSLFKLFQDYCKRRIEIYNRIKQKTRLPNFPEDISENIVKFIVRNIEKKECCNISGGDLQICDELNIMKTEVKCFSSDGPTSFGPTEKWDIIYFLDATNHLNNQFVCYKIILSNTSYEWKSLKVNKNETFSKQCEQKRRPRMNFQQIQKQLSKEFIQVIYKGGIEDIVTGQTKK